MSFVCEFQEIRNGRYFGHSEHPTREAAARHAVKTLIELGESRGDAEAAVAVAGWTCADTRHDGYGVRIYEE